MANIAELKEIEQKLKERLAKVQAQKAQKEKKLEAREKAKERKLINQKKYILGGFFLRYMADNENFRNQAMEKLNEALKNPRHRELFELPPLVSVDQQPSGVGASAPFNQS